ncbi:MAG: phosphoribosylglycinamide formyltransferase [Kiritimatiellia bacterium]
MKNTPPASRIPHPQRSCSAGGNPVSHTIRIAVLGSGRGTNCQSIIDAIAAGTLNATLVGVIADVDSAGILTRAERHSIPARHIPVSNSKTRLDGEPEQTYIRQLQEWQTDYVVLAGFMRIIKPAMLAAFPNRILNIHPSLLPAFPGIAAWKQALEYGVKVAGCTVHLVDEGTDTGPILIQRTVPVLENDTPETLHARIQQQEHIAYPEALKQLAVEKTKYNNT